MTMEPELPMLPLLLWETSRAVEIMLGQAGVAFDRLASISAPQLARGRFVLCDRRSGSFRKLSQAVTDRHVLIDLDEFRAGEPYDPFAAILDLDAALTGWKVGPFVVKERVARFDKGAIRDRFLVWLRRRVQAQGGLWAQLAAVPRPYRAAFNLRVDLDERYPADYHRFAELRRPISGCTTHFLSTAAYENEPTVLRDLMGLDVQSHGHFHHVYRGKSANSRNLRLAHERLVAEGFSPVGFAAPGGRWNAGLDAVLEDQGYLYSSDFSLGYDDPPFFPWLGNRFSKVLQVPIHPICEGLFLEQTEAHVNAIARYYGETIQAKLAAGENAFVYGHPERRLARMPGVLARIAEEAAAASDVWRTTLTEYAAWWRWRADRRWTVLPRGGDRMEVLFEDWDTAYPMRLDVWRGDEVASLPLESPRTLVPNAGLNFTPRRPQTPRALPRPVKEPRGLKETVREAIDWETVTPLEELPADTLTDRLKRTLRRTKDRRPAAGARS